MSSDAVGAVTGEAKTAQGLVPKLRFPEFRDAGAWREKVLGDCLDYEQPTAYLVANTAYDPSYPTPVLTAGKTFVLGYTNEEHGIYGDGLPVIIFDDFTTAIQFVDFPFKAKSSAMKILTPKAGTNIKFMYELLAANPYEVGAHERHWISKFDPMPVVVPDKAEQQKIADCLSSLDAVIVAEVDRLAALRDHKNGLMQQLFPRPERIENGEKIRAETIPRLRFPEFQNAGDWEERPLGDLLECPPAYGVNAAAVPYDERLPTYLRITDISEDGRFIDADKTSVNVVATEASSMQPDDIALTRTGASVGKAYLHTEANGPLVFAGFLIRVRPDQRRALSQIVFQYMQTQAYWSWVLKTSARSGQPGLNSAEYSALRIPLPPDGPDGLLREQRQIANFLSSIDDLAIALTDRITALKAHKTGLMQQLFPSPAERGA